MALRDIFLKSILLSSILLASYYADAAVDLKPESAVATIDQFVFEPVYCDLYQDANVYGYSLYRAQDRKDLGNAVWNNSNLECDEAAQLANEVQAGIVCSLYYNSANGTTSYSVYRIWDDQDLGYATIGDFADCQTAVQGSRNGIFCSTYILNNQVWWSMYDIQTGQDLGTQVYATIQECEQQY